MLPRVAPRSEERERAFLVDPAHLELASAPAWFDGPIEENLRAALAALAPAPLRDDDDVSELLNSLAGASGWIRSLDRVEKRYPNRLEIEVTLRRPVALLETEDELVLVDAEGVVVAPAAEAGRFLERHELPLVHGPRPLADGTPGTIVRDRWLEEGLRVALELAPHRGTLADRMLHLDVIDVSAQASPSRSESQHGGALTEVELWTREGIAIEWGRSSTHPQFGALELPPDAKVRALLRVAAKHPELAGIRRIRLQFDQPFVIRDETSPVARLGPS